MKATALLIIDMINEFSFPGAEAMVPEAERCAQAIVALRDRLRGVPCIYVNDNFGRWDSSFDAILEISARPGSKGRQVAEVLRPRRGDFSVLKPMHSGFFQTPLDLLLRHLEMKQLILCGTAANVCVSVTAFDAHMRGYKVIIPEDCVVSKTPEETSTATGILREYASATVCRSEELPEPAS